MQLFIIYAREDSNVREKILQVIEEPLNEIGIDIWHDKKIPLGNSWDNNIKEHLKKSAIFLLVISDHFFKSSFIQSVEFSQAIERHESQEGLIIAFFAGVSNWKNNNQLKAIQGFPRDGIPYAMQKNKKKLLEEFKSEILEAVELFIKEYEKLQKKNLAALLERSKRIEKDRELAILKYQKEAEEKKHPIKRIKYFFRDDNYKVRYFFMGLVEWIMDNWSLIWLLIEWIIAIWLISLFIKKCT